MPKAFKLRRANELVGLFILLGLSLVVVVILLGPQTRRWFTPTRTISVQLPPEGSLGLRKGADVQILGSVVGSVEDITVTDGGEMQAEVSIRGNFIRFVRKDSVAIIRKQLGIGDASIEITRGRGDTLPLTGAVLSSMADKAPTQMVEETLTAFRNEALPAIKEVRVAISEYTKLAEELRGEQKNVQMAMDHLNKLGSSLERDDNFAGMLLNDPKPPEEIRKALPKLNTSLDELQTTLQDTRKVATRLPEIAAELEAVLKNAKETSDQARKAAADLPALEKSAKVAVDAVPGLVLQVQETSRQIQRLAEALQRSFLVRGNMDSATGEMRLKSDRVGTDR